ncbi:condensin complex protein MksE [Methylobacter sp.]|uniref:condensin complex protein MksE n=1 Tax=Methylobacter sp. TaxID=2051955 RepID=UPI002FDD8BE0
MFDQLLKRLLQGEFICEVIDEAGFRYLQDPENAAQVDAFLTRLDYRLSSTQNRLAFFAAYRTIDSSARSDIRKVFYQFRIELQPVVEWLDMMMSCLNQDTALSPGDTLSFSGLLQVIEQNQALADRLQTFAKFKDFTSGDDSVKGRLEKLLTTLQKWNYLNLANRDTLIYQVTGKLDYFYQALQFIQEHEQIPVEQGETDAIQGSLF